MFKALKSKFGRKDEMSEVSLSRGLEIVNKMKRRPGYEPTWYTPPVNLMIEMYGDVLVKDVTPMMVEEWYVRLRETVNTRTKEPLSPYTVNRRARGLKAYFGNLVKVGHLDESPAAKLRLRKLPTTSKNAISEDDLEALIRAARVSPRNYAIVLTLRDSGARAGELASMVRGKVISERFYEIPGDGKGVLPKIVILDDNELPPDGFEARWRSKAMVYGSKMSDIRWVYFKHEATLALMDYLERRSDTVPAVWLSTKEEKPLSKGGIYLMLKGLAKKADVETYNPHAFRHRLAKRLKEARVDPEIIAKILGHADVQTYQRVYGLTTESELADYHTIFAE